MLIQEVRAYKVQSEKDKDKWHQVSLEPQSFWIKGKCDCKYYLNLGMHCEHIKRAITCYKYGY